LDCRDDLPRDAGWRRRVQQCLAVRPPEAERSIWLSRDAIALLVDRPMMPAAENHQIREHCRTTVGPVADVMTLAEGDMAARKAATSIPMLERPSNGRRNRARPRSDLHGSSVRIVPHEYAVRVTGESLRRFRGNVRTVFQCGLSGIDVQHYLIALGG